MTKKILALLLAMSFAFTLMACGGDKTDDTSDVSGVDSGTTSEIVSTDDTADNTESTGSDAKQDSSKKDESGAQQTASTKSNASTTSKQSLTTQGKVENNATTSKNTASKAGTTSKVNASTKKNITAAYKNIKVKRGKSVSQGLDFGGKTFTMAITEEGQYNTASFKRCITAFEKEYNCKITTKTLKFSTYNQQVSQAIAGKNSYDICYAHGSMFPACAIDKLYEDVSDYLRTSDLMDDDNPTAGGIDLAKSSYFYYKNALYGTCNFSSCFPYVIYYNKVMMADAGYSGNKDPRKLAENGKWSWNVIKAMGKKLTDASANVYFLSNSFSGRGICLAYGAPIVTVNNGKYSQNITSNAYMSALKMMQSLFVGNNKIANTEAGAYNSYESMLKGQAYMWTEETSKYLDVSKAVKSSSALNRSKDNIGLVAMPLGETNTAKAYPTGWLTAVCTGKGKDPRVAIAWDVFRSSYKDPVTDSNAMSATDKAYTDSFLDGDISCEVGKFSTSSEDTLGLTEGSLIPKIIKGADVSKEVTAVKDQMTACINATIK